jgi:hypothetical protein
MLRWYGYLLGTGEVRQMYCVLSSQQERNVTILFHIPDQPITVCHRALHKYVAHFKGLFTLYIQNVKTKTVYN